MYKIISVKPKPDFELELIFQGKEKKIFDVKPYLDKGIFKELKNVEYFNKVFIKYDSVAWPHQQDFSPDTLYLLGK